MIPLKKIMIEKRDAGIVSFSEANLADKQKSSHGRVNIVDG
jgi:hypothetical protein